MYIIVNSFDEAFERVFEDYGIKKDEFVKSKTSESYYWRPTKEEVERGESDEDVFIRVSDHRNEKHEGWFEDNLYLVQQKSLN